MRAIYIPLVFTLLLIANSASSKEPVFLSNSIDPIPDLKTFSAEFLLELKKLEDSNLTLKEFKKKQKKIINAFKQKRVNQYKNIRLRSTVSCQARAARPSPTKGRNSDRCLASLPNHRYRKDWLYDTFSVREIGRLEGGKASYSVEPSQDKRSLTLNVSCRSPSWSDTSSGHCDLIMELHGVFIMADHAIEHKVNAEVGILMSNM